MTTTPNDPTTALPGRPPVVDLATWQAARDELLVREKAHTREGVALAGSPPSPPVVEAVNVSAREIAGSACRAGSRSWPHLRQATRSPSRSPG